MSDNTDKKRLLKKVLLRIGIVLVALLVILGALSLVSKVVGNTVIDFTEKQDGIYYFPEDYDQNISEDLFYMTYDRAIYFTDPSGYCEKLTEETAEENKVKNLFLKYFEALMSGDAAEHEKLLSEKYKEKFKVQQKFTPQKIYNISVSYMTTENDKDIYKVVYSIYENDGSYRADIGSNISRIMAFTIDKSSNEALIDSIGYITEK